MVEPKKTVPTAFEFTDIAGIVKGASKGEGLGNKFLAHIREVDAICQVVRAFDDENVTHVSGKVDPIDDIEIINMELIFADLESVEKRIPRLEKMAKQKDKDYAGKEGSEVIVISAKVEEEIAVLDEDEKEMFLEDLGIEESGLDKLIKAAYNLLGLATYFTAGGRGSPGMDLQGRHVRTGMCRHHPYRFPKRLHPCRDGKL